MHQPPLEKPVFLLGVGTQKSGTSWLHLQLQNSPKTNMGLLKEYHIWDALFIPHFAHFRAQDPQPNHRWLDADFAGFNAQQLKFAMQNVEGFYESYFQTQVTGSASITGDFTPSYSGLAAKDFALIRSRLEAAGFAVKVIFLMRDPVARNWSSLRMRRAMAQAQGEQISDQQLLARFKPFYESAESLSRTRYDLTVERLKETFDCHQLYFGFYENMFEEPSLASLINVLGIARTDLDVDQKVNVSNRLELPHELAAECRSFYSGVYDYCRSEFPVSQTLWR
ncbi:hypothetical protein [Pseudophaeobacter sp. TrK17]|uniref:hypothetical protein n=1 Tax=Pseudophaeobacter sp. TrK17 TaxID=2815167 RepID=UPI0035CED151